MSELKKAFIQRFGENRVSDYPSQDGDYIDLLKIEVEKKFPLTILCTNGLSLYNMPVPERYKGLENNEIFFCLPGYWDLEDKDNPNMNWPLKVIQKLAENVMENQLWYGPGHTIANGNPSTQVSETMKQDNFLLAEPIVLEDLFAPLKVGDKEVRFLAIIPIYHREFERKMHEGYPKWIKKFRARNGNEILDDYRHSIYKSRWKLF
ncbi:suppressor of fused domain protein [Brumimicrobium sp.]|uniref:suppressor of fused domain protein n=1 Tax=Brumimicrobium sp. TaxID=2029867 RepID=UPI003A8D25CD